MLTTKTPLLLLLPLLLLITISLPTINNNFFTLAHDHSTNNNNMNDNDNDEEDDHSSTTTTTNTSVEQSEIKKQQALVALHVFIMTVVTIITLPISVGLVAGRRPDSHKILAAINWMLLLFAGLIAAMGFADGESGHAAMGITCLVLWTAQATYGLVRHFFYRTSLSITPHRTFGILILIFTPMTWFSGFAHLSGSCTEPSDVPMCEAHIYLGGFFVLVGLLHIYYPIDKASKWETFLIGFGGLSELVGEGLGDLVLNAIDSKRWPWNAEAKQLHLSAATMWLLAAIISCCISWRKPTLSTRGIALLIGIFFHLIFMFTHAQHDEIIQSSHMAHSAMLIPVLLFRPYEKLQMLVGILLILSGFFFASAADPIVRDAHYSSSSNYVLIVFLFASMVVSVHCFISLRLIQRPEREAYPDTIWERSRLSACCGRLLCCFPCLKLTVIGNEYEVIEIKSTTATTNNNRVIDSDGLGEMELVLENGGHHHDNNHGSIHNKNNTNVVDEQDDGEDDGILKEDVSVEPSSSSSRKNSKNKKKNNSKGGGNVNNQV
jgi:hypothetical protein